MTEFVKRDDLGLTDFEIVMCDGDYKEALKMLLDKIEKAPAADVVEVRHERWDLAKDPFGAGYVKCSRCGYKHCPEYYPDGSAIMHLFCPSCGAKMDGDGE